jgi:hypothetical protein
MIINLNKEKASKMNKIQKFINIKMLLLIKIKHLLRKFKLWNLSNQ